MQKYQKYNHIQTTKNKKYKMTKTKIQKQKK